MKDTNTEGYIAIWLGTFHNQEEFKEYKKVHYECDDAIDSQFEKDFGLKYYDRDIVEASFFAEEYNTIRTLFEGSSYLEKYTMNLNNSNKLKYNVMIRIYDYTYDGQKKHSEYKGNDIVFYDNIEYEKIVDLSWMW